MSDERSPWIVDTTDATFEADVIERSRDAPVVVDFWAEWCQPCRMLSPLLEKLAREMDGKFVLVKANTEQAPQAATEFAVQAIPTVFGVRDGQPVDFFTGLLPEPALREWLDRLLPSEAQVAVQAGRLQLESDPQAAEAKFREALKLDENEPAAKIALADALARQQRLTEAAELIADLQQRGFLEPEAERVKAALELQKEGQQAGDVDELRSAVAANPADLNARLKLAEALAARQDYEEALQISLELVEQDRKAVGKSARQIMLDIFQVLPEGSELTTEYRRRLSTALY